MPRLWKFVRYVNTFQWSQVSTTVSSYNLELCIHDWLGETIFEIVKYYTALTLNCPVTLLRGQTKIAHQKYVWWDFLPLDIFMRFHYTNIIMGTIASQITSLTIVYSTVYSDADQKNIKAPHHWPLCGEFTGTCEFPAQMASNAENVSIWWHHVSLLCCLEKMFNKQSICWWSEMQ